MSGGRRQAVAAAGVLAVVSVSAAGAEEDAIRLAEVRSTVDRATAYLIEHQAPAGFFDREFRAGSGSEAKRPKEAAALAALATIGLISVGHLPGDPTPEGEAVMRALDFVLREAAGSKEGYFGDADGSRMYGHGIITLLFAELLGMGVSEEQDEVLRERCQAGVDLILRAQQATNKKPAHYGGWRYAPNATDSDISVSVWQVMALRAAKNAGLDVPKGAIDDAVAYIKRSSDAKPESVDQAEPEEPVAAAGFSYQVDKKSAKMSTTAAGLLSLQVCGEYDAAEVAAAAEYLLQNPPAIGDAWLFYGLYYYAQGMYQRGGKYEATARRRTEELLLPIQAFDGSWWAPKNESKQGPIYSTALALLSLSVRYHLLPIYQR